MNELSSSSLELETKLFLGHSLQRSCACLSYLTPPSQQRCKGDTVIPTSDEVSVKTHPVTTFKETPLL